MTAYKKKLDERFKNDCLYREREIGRQEWSLEKFGFEYEA